MTFKNQRTAPQFGEEEEVKEMPETETNRQKLFKVTSEIILYYGCSFNVPVAWALLAAPGQLMLFEIITSHAL